MSNIYDKNSKLYPDISIENDTIFRINRIRDKYNYLFSEIREREKISKSIGKYVSILNYIDKSFIVLTTISGGVSVTSFVTAIGAPVGLASASVSFIFAISSGLVKKLLNLSFKKKHKHKKLLF